MAAKGFFLRLGSLDEEKLDVLVAAENERRAHREPYPLPPISPTQLLTIAARMGLAEMQKSEARLAQYADKQRQLRENADAAKPKR